MAVWALLAHEVGPQVLTGPVWVDLANKSGFSQSVQRVKNIGFQGKLCIQTDQVAIVNDAFTPNAEQVARAQKIVDALASENAGSAAIQVDGQFVDYPILYQAQRVLAVLEKIKGSRSVAR